MFVIKKNKEAYWEPCQTSKMELFAKTVDIWRPLTIFCKMLHLSCLTGFWIQLSIELRDVNTWCVLAFVFSGVFEKQNCNLVTIKCLSQFWFMLIFVNIFKIYNVTENSKKILLSRIFLHCWLKRKLHRAWKDIFLSHSFSKPVYGRLELHLVKCK